MVSTRAIGKKIGQKLANTAKSAAQTAASTAKSQLDQALLNLQHSRLKPLRESHDLIERVGRGVLERAESIRQQIAQAPFTPLWLKNLSLVTQGDNGRVDEKATATSPVWDETALEDASAGENIEVVADAASSLTDSTISEPAQEMQAEPLDEVLEEEKEASLSPQEKEAEETARQVEARLMAAEPAPRKPKTQAGVVRTKSAKKVKAKAKSGKSASGSRAAKSKAGVAGASARKKSRSSAHISK